jgi:hypothetical protein
MNDNLFFKSAKKHGKSFVLPLSVKNLNEILNGELPTSEESYRLISLSGGLASITFIKYIAEKSKIEELTASTLRIGEKQFNYLLQMRNTNMLGKASFFVSTMQRDLDKQNANKNSRKKYNYYKRYKEQCKKNGWNNYVLNNHAKIILMKTKNDYFVLETSSNLNENPKIEQYCLSNDKSIYDFYYFDVFEKLKSVSDTS